MKTALVTMLFVSLCAGSAAANGNGPAKPAANAAVPKQERPIALRKTIKPREGSSYAYAARSYGVPTIVGIAY